ncbi:hypothetical protein FO433_02475 [Weissella cibaria]|uniref:hypothetical protein n=1 Tax=Weissella cibaria TaxID=137591 RepID=UPI001192C96A|nr:hypothetical protein [Weissella cibaria]TVV24741.1 hypothetical protein FO433_02475 [Weissella cibaria]TVV31756.1 hypothetical protein FO434_05705 [Weissella cibaria]
MKYDVISSFSLNGKTEVTLDVAVTDMPTYKAALDADGNLFKVLRFTFPKTSGIPNASLVLEGIYKGNQIELLN